VLPQPVTVRGSDFRIRVSDILKASRQSHRRVSDIRREFSGSFDKVFDYRYKGIYVDFWVGVELCRRYGLIQLEKELRTWKGVPQEPVKELRTWKGVPQEPVKEPELSEFTEITDFPNPVMVRMSDFRINATHIVKLAGRSRFTLMSLRNRLNSGNYDILRGTRKRDGTYVGFDIGIELCRKYGLVELEKRLYNLKPSSEGPVLDAEPSHTRAPSQTSRLLREPPDSNSVSPRNSSSEPMGIRDRDQLLATLRGDIIDEPIQAEDASEMDSGSDAAGSEASVISCKPLLERSAQLQAHKPIRRGKDSALSRHSSTDLPYSVWDSEPRYSQLSEVKPDLKPHSWETASPYPSFTDMY